MVKSVLRTYIDVMHISINQKDIIFKGTANLQPDEQPALPDTPAGSAPASEAGSQVRECWLSRVRSIASTFTALQTIAVRMPLLASKQNRHVAGQHAPRCRAQARRATCWDDWSPVNEHVSRSCDTACVAVQDPNQAADILDSQDPFSLNNLVRKNLVTVEDRMVRLGRQADIYDKLTASLAPSIWSMDDVKKGILCQLFGATVKARLLSWRLGPRRSRKLPCLPLHQATASMSAARVLPALPCSTFVACTAFWPLPSSQRTAAAAAAQQGMQVRSMFADACRRG